MAGSVIAGTVRSRSGEPIAEAQVFFTRVPVDVPDIAGLTDENGGFSLYAPAPGEYTIECSAFGFEAGSVELEVDGSGSQIEVGVELAAT